MIVFFCGVCRFELLLSLLKKMSCKKPPPAPISILRGHKGAVTALHFTNEVDDVITDKPSLISGSDSGEIFIWSMKVRKIVYFHYIKFHFKIN